MATRVDPYFNPDAGAFETESDYWADVLEWVAMYRRVADENGQPHDPEWDQWEMEARARLEDDE